MEICKDIRIWRLWTYVRFVVNAGDFEGGVRAHSPGEGERGRLLGETPKTEERQHCDLNVYNPSCFKLYRGEVKW